MELCVVDPTKTREQGEELETIIGNTPKPGTWAIRSEVAWATLAIIVEFVALVGGLVMYVDFQQLCDS